MKPQVDGEVIRSIAPALLLLILLVCAAVGFFESQINIGLNDVAEWGNVGYSSSDANVAFSFIFFIFLVLPVSFLVMPSLLVEPWILSSLGVLCIVAGVYIRFRYRKRGEREV